MNGIERMSSMKMTTNQNIQFLMQLSTGIDMSGIDKPFRSTDMQILRIRTVDN